MHLAVQMAVGAGGHTIMATGKKSRFEELKAKFEGMGLREIRQILKRKGDLDLYEAALYLGYTSPRSLYNRISRMKRDPMAGPDGVKLAGCKSGRLRFRVEALEAWERSRSEKIGE